MQAIKKRNLQHDIHKANAMNTNPTDEQIKRASWFGWLYTGDGVFIRGNDLGWFEGRHFKREAL